MLIECSSKSKVFAPVFPFFFKYFFINLSFGKSGSVL
jgi:hypothetical protein